MGDFLKKDMDKLVKDMQADRVTIQAEVMTLNDLTEAEESLQYDLSKKLISRLIEIIESQATIEYDENEDGKFTSIVIDTPNTRELLKDAILDNYILGTK